MSIFSYSEPIIKLARKHLPEVAIWTGTFLEGLAVISGIKETPNALAVLEQRKPDSLAQKAEIIVPAYWKTITCFTIGTILILTGNHLHLERTAIALGIAATQKDKLMAMTEETKKLLGPKKIQELEENVEARKVDVQKISEQKPVNLGGDQLFVCSWNNFAFYSTVSKVKDMANEILRETMACKCIDLFDVENIMGIPSVKGEYRKGWNIDHPPVLKISSWKNGPDGQPFGILSITPDPEPGWVLDSGYLF